jgi:hypothetical protein
MKRDVSIMPSRADVSKAVKIAMHDRDPIIRAEAAARLTLWGFPASAVAIVMAAEREVLLAN